MNSALFMRRLHILLNTPTEVEITVKYSNSSGFVRMYSIQSISQPHFSLE